MGGGRGGLLDMKGGCCPLSADSTNGVVDQSMVFRSKLHTCTHIHIHTYTETHVPCVCVGQRLMCLCWTANTVSEVHSLELLKSPVWLSSILRHPMYPRCLCLLDSF